MSDQAKAPEMGDDLAMLDDLAAEKYCDRPRCAQMTPNDKAWHRAKAAFLEGILYERERANSEIERLKSEAHLHTTIVEQLQRAQAAAMDIEREARKHDLARIQELRAALGKTKPAVAVLRNALDVAGMKGGAEAADSLWETVCDALAKDGGTCDP